MRITLPIFYYDYDLAGRTVPPHPSFAKTPPKDADGKREWMDENTPYPLEGEKYDL